MSSCLFIHPANLDCTTYIEAVNRARSVYPGQGAQGARANPSCVMSPVSGKCQTLVHTDTGSGIKIALRQLVGWSKSTYILLKAGIPILRLLCCRSELLYLTQRIFPKHKVSVKTCFHFHILTSITSTLPVWALSMFSGACPAWDWAHTRLTRLRCRI